MPVAGFPMQPRRADECQGLERFRREVMPYLPESVRRAVVLYISRPGAAAPEEVRLRVLRPVRLVGREGDACLDSSGQRVEWGGLVTEPADMLRAIELVSGSSLYALEDQIRLGFVTIPGGHRVGLSGTAISEGACVRGLRDISGLNYRVAMDARGSAEAVVPLVTWKDGTALNTLVISPPGCGKTTLLRDIVRCLSDGEAGARPSRVSLIDERSEVAACVAGVPGNYVGQRTDVLDACPKAAGIMMAIRSLSPEVVATDEIGRPEDAAAIAEAVASGVRVIATVHARDLAEAMRRPVVAGMLRDGSFERFVVLSRRFGPGTVESVQDVEPGAGVRVSVPASRGVGAGVRKGARAADARPRELGRGTGDCVGLLLPR